MCADFAQIKAQRSPHTWCGAMVAPARIPLSPRARIMSHMVKIGTPLTLWFQTLSHRNLTSRATMNAEFAQTKAYCSSHTFREAIAVSDHHYMGPQARSRRHIVRIGTPLTPWIQPPRPSKFGPPESPCAPISLKQKPIVALIPCTKP